MSRETAMNWYILRVATRQEKRAVEALKEMKVDHYLPMETVERVINREEGPVDRPLLPGYLFALIADVDFHTVTHANGVHAPVRYTNNRGERVARSIPAALVQAMREAQAAGNFDRTRKEPEPEMQVGDSLRIKAGPFEGLIGAMLEKRGEQRVLVLLRSATVEMDLIDLEAA